MNIIKLMNLLKENLILTELAIFSAMWNEHCSYKSSRKHLKNLHTKGSKVIQGPGENAGVVDIGDEDAIVLKLRVIIIRHLLNHTKVQQLALVEL